MHHSRPLFNLFLVTSNNKNIFHQIYVKVNYLAPAAKTRTHDLYLSRLLPLKHEKHTAKKLGMVH